MGIKHGWQSAAPFFFEIDNPAGNPSADIVKASIHLEGYVFQMIPHYLMDGQLTCGHYSHNELKIELSFDGDKDSQR